MIKLLNTDCMEYMQTVPDKYFDLAIVDPPYGIGNFVQVTGNVRGKKVQWNNSTPDGKYFDELKRISKHRIIWGSNYYNCFEGSGAIVWEKNQPMEDFSKCEIASCTFHNKVELYKQTWTNYVNTKQTDHPCEKPVQLYKWLLKNYAKPEFKIIDTHLGSGSSAIAAYDFGIAEFVGTEIDSEYFKAAEQRFKIHTMQKTFSF